MKKIAICMVLLLCFTSVIAFAQENKYVVTITYAGEDGKILTEKISILSTSASEAETKATRQWEALKQADWVFKFANAEKIDEAPQVVQPQVVTPQTIGYIDIINAHPWPTDISETKMYIRKIYIKLSSASAYELHSSVNLHARGQTSTSIALPTGIYDIKLDVYRNWFNPRYGDESDTVSAECRNVVVREDMTTDVSMRGGRAYASQPRRK